MATAIPPDLIDPRRLIGGPLVQPKAAPLAPAPLPGQMPGMMPGMPSDPTGVAAATPVPQQPNLGARLLDGLTPGMTSPPGPQWGAPDMADPVLGEMIGTATPQPLLPMLDVPDRMKPGYMPPLETSVWRELVSIDEERHRSLMRRFGRDLGLYRQKDSAVPPGFDPKREIAFKSATMSNVVNKLTNMSAPMDFRYEVPFKDERTRTASQVVENWHSHLRRCEELEYARAGGSTKLSQDEYFYLYLYGRVCCRILPAPHKPEDPFDMELVDPATVYPTWGGNTEGLVRLIHKRPMTAIDVMATYLPYAPNLDQRMRDSVVKDFSIEDDPRRFFHVERDLIECWDTWNQFVMWGDVEIINVPHKLGFVPWVYVMARGEPRGMSAPQGRVWRNNWDPGDDVPEWEEVNPSEDLAEKGVGVFHAIRNANRMTEIVYTLLLTQVLSASDPATITYSASALAGKPPPPLNFKPGGNNQRTLNAQKVELVPTSPRPTDVSPIMSKLGSDIAEGTVNPAMYGSVEGSNIAGFAIESMIAAARDTVLPYLRAWEVYQGLKASMKTVMYRERIMPLGIRSTPTDGRYGTKPTEDLTPEVIEAAGTQITCEIVGVSDQQLPMMVNAAGAAVERGFWSRRQAMEKLGEKDPDRRLWEIIRERAQEHPEIMENYLIPLAFLRNGQRDLCQLWVFMVVMPKIQQLMAQMLGPAAMGAGAGLSALGMGDPSAMMPPGGAAPPGIPAPSGAPEPNGQSNPMAMRDRGRPTGPEPGQGRGPAPAGR